MKNNFIFWFIISTVIMLVLPWLAISFVKGDAGMAVCFILFFAINPLYSVMIGVFACLKIAFCKMCFTLCGRFDSNLGGVAGYID